MRPAEKGRIFAFKTEHPAPFPKKAKKAKKSVDNAGKV